MARKLESEDIQALLAGFAAAIELDQLRVDSMPRELFHPYYEDSMWRSWRKDHICYVDQLLASVNAISPELLEELTWVAVNYEPAVVAEIALNLFAEVASGDYAQEELETARLFFARLIQELKSGRERRPIGRDAKALMFQWLPVTDPLRIAQDSECGYGQPTGFVN